MGKRLRAFMNLSRQSVGANLVGMIVELSGTLTIEQVKDALNRLSPRHPTLRTVIKDSKHFAVSSIGNGPLVDVEECTDGSSPLQVWEKLQLIELEMGKPLIKIRVVQHQGRRDLVVACEHLVCDGVSLTSFTNELLQTMDNPTQTWEPRNPTPLGTVCSGQSLGSRFGRAKGIWNLVKSVMNLNGSNFIKPTNYSGEMKTILKQPILMSNKYTLAAEDMSRLRKMGKEKCITVTPIFIFACLKAMANMIDKENPPTQNFSVGVPVNLRPFYNKSKGYKGPKLDGSELAFYAGSVMKKYHLGESSSPELAWRNSIPNIHADVISATKDIVVLSTILIDYITLRTVPSKDLRMAMTISNWGLSNFNEEYGQGIGKVLGAWPMCRVQYFACPYVSTLTVNGVLEVVAQGSTLYSQDQFDDLAKGIVDMLKWLLSDQ